MQVKKRSILIFLSIGIIIGILATTLMLAHLRQPSQTAERAAPPPPSETDTSMNRLFQVSTREGRTEWKLEAASAEMDKTKKIAQLKDVSIVFYPKSGGEVSLTAERGVIHTVSKDIEVSGNVVVVNRNYKMVTEKLKYKDSNRTLTSSTPLAISDNSSSLMADHMVYYLAKNKSVFKGNVMGFFSDKTNL